MERGDGMQTKVFNEEVLYTTAAVTRVTRADVETLKAAAGRNRRKRIRLCAHMDPAAAVHEMIIVHARDTYVRPHRHVGKTESFHVVEGQLTLVVFDDAGTVRDVIRMGEYASGRPFYHRITEDLYHTVLIESDVAVFHETTSGPFRREDMEFAVWAPPAEETDAARRFTNALARDLEQRERMS